MADAHDSAAELNLCASAQADQGDESPVLPSKAHRDGSAPLLANETERLALLDQCLILDTPPDPDFDDLTRLAALLCGTPIALISLIDESRQWFKSRVGLAATETPRRMAFCAHAILNSTEVMVVPDATQDMRFADNELVTGVMGIRFYAGAPLIMEEGLALGSLCVIDTQPRKFSARQQEALAALARQVVSQIRLRRQNFALQQAEAEREQFFTRPLDMLCVAGADGYFKRLNPAFSETLGFSQQELLAESIFSFVHPDDVAATQAAMARVVTGASVLNFEHRFRCRDGSYRWLSWKCAPALDGVLYASARDVTEGKLLEEVMRRQQAELRLFFDYIPALVCFKDTKNGLLRVNKRLADTLGKTVEEVEGRSTEELYPQDAAKYYADDLEVLRSGVPKLGIVETFRDVENREIWIQTDKVPVRDRDGNITGLVAMAQDISERKRVEAHLVASEKRFREAIEYSAIGMALVGLEGRWLKVNRALCAILNRTESELEQCTFQDITHPDDLATNVGHAQSLLAGEQDHYEMEKRYLRPDGRVVWAHLAVTLVRDAEGQAMYFVSQIQDITERVRAEKLLKASLAEKETLLKEVHHRVKNNLQVITSLLQLQAEGLSDPQLLGLFREAQDRVRAMALIHEGLYRTGQLAAVNFGTHLLELVEILLRSYGTRGVPVRLEAETQPVELDIDVAVPLSLIVNELVTNAFKYAFAGGRGGTLRVVFQALETGLLFLSIGDDGPGLPEAYDWEKSSSLGLKIVRILVAQIGGQMEIVSQPNPAFAITFPRTRKS